VADCPGAVRYAPPEQAACQLLRQAAEVCRHRPAVLPEEAQSEPAPPLRAGQAGASGRARPLPAADPVQHRLAALAGRAQARLQPAVSAQLAVSPRRAALWRAEVQEASQALPDGAAEAERQPAAPAVAGEPRQEAVAQQGGAAAERQPAAAWAAVGEQRRAEAVVRDVAAGLQPEVVPDAAGVRQPAAPDVPAAAQPSVVPSVCRRDQLPPWPVQAPAAHPAHAMRGRRMA
jgi:hypothetical protein